MLNDFLNGDLNQQIVKIDTTKCTDDLLRNLPEKLVKDINEQYTDDRQERRKKTISQEGII